MKSIKLLILAAAISIILYSAINSYTEGIDFRGGKTFIVGDTTDIKAEITLSPNEQRSIDSFNSGFDSLNTRMKVRPVIKTK